MKQIEGYEGYFVDQLGNVYSRKFNREIKMKQSISIHGYYRVRLCKDGKVVNKSVHRLVAEAFILNPNNKIQVNHINCIKTDNRVENLEWCTAIENMKHAYENNLVIAVHGEKHQSAKLSELQILLIRKDNRLHKEISKQYMVSRGHISRIKSIKAWKHI